MYRLSPTLLDSFRYYLSIEDDARSEVARAELLARLRGERSEPNEAMQKGIDFEDAVVAEVSGDVDWHTGNDKYDTCVCEAAGYVHGCAFQVHVERELDGIMLHGYIDALRANHIIDIKTTSKYALGKYLKNMQHRIYLYCLEPDGVDTFTYFVTDFRQTYREHYFWNPYNTDHIKSRMAEWFDYLAVDKEMNEAWEARNEADCPHS